MELIGIVAGFCTTASFVPQVVHTWRTKSVADISLRMYLMLCLGVALWIVYGILIGSLSVLLANLATFVLAASVLGMKLRYGRLSRKRDKRGP
ncbi:hypothetical protein GM415_11025 [Pseudodesulfovibrio cashew]|uniref:Glutathione synthetase n=2 Tax=Pseudodesulfovibrio cashew TaxID=2678688 RepID=A0A6I6JPU8_9BACT|nr:hypothetical protein GM415_11025 [Pseudodesulfovibrio cashew]